MSLQWSASAGRLLRESKFVEAEAAYSQAVALDHTNVQGHLGLGRIATLRSEKRQAAKHFSTAYQIDPHNPDVILAFAGVMENREARLTLLRNFLALARDHRVQAVRQKLQVEEQIGNRTASVLSSPYEPYRIPLFSSRTGLLLHAKINGGRELKLIVDTGASGVVLNASSARGMNLELLAQTALAGFGSGPMAQARLALAASFESGEFQLANLLLEISQMELTVDADGVVGLDLFENFLIRVDARARVLALTPFADEPPLAACPDCVPTYRLGHLLLVHGKVNGASDGYFILDSGAPCSLVSRKLFPRESGRSSEASGVQGTQDLGIPSTPVSIELGGKHFFDFEYATLDTDEISSRNGAEISGAIGLSMLRNVALTIDYRDGWVKLGKP